MLLLPTAAMFFFSFIFNFDFFFWNFSKSDYGAVRPSCEYDDNDQRNRAARSWVFEKFKFQNKNNNFPKFEISLSKKLVKFSQRFEHMASKWCNNLHRNYIFSFQIHPKFNRNDISFLGRWKVKGSLLFTGWPVSILTTSRTRIRNRSNFTNLIMQNLNPKSKLTCMSIMVLVSAVTVHI